MHMSAFTLPPPHSQRVTTPFSNGTFFPCFFSLSPMGGMHIQEEDHTGDLTYEGKMSPIATHVILPSIVFLFWIFLLHVPFQMLGSGVAAGLKHFHVITVDEDLPWYRIDPILRVSTTVADAIRIFFWVALNDRYKAAGKSTVVSISSSSGGGRLSEEDHTDYKSIDDHIINEPSQNSNSPSSKFLPTREWINLAFWSTLAWPLRMGDTFRSTGMYDSYWTPLAAYGVSRVAALAIGAIPGCIGGIPSLTTSLGLGLFYASRREQFERNVELLLAATKNNEHDHTPGFEETFLENEIEDKVRERNSEWGYRLRTVLGYAYFTCFMVLWDAEILDSTLTKKVEEK